jgi:hypothetical protein
MVVCERCKIPVETICFGYGFVAICPNCNDVIYNREVDFRGENRKIPVIICPKCNRVRKFGKWVPYEEVCLILAERKDAWIKVSMVCPSCE